MSLHKFFTKEGRLIHYGLDLPTGGFFYNEFFTEEEMLKRENYEELKSYNQALTLTEFQKELEKSFELSLDIKQCFDDINSAEPPTPFQHMINERLGYNLQAMLDKFSTDLVQNWM